MLLGCMIRLAEPEPHIFWSLTLSHPDTQISEAFGLHGLSQNWGTMTVSAVISGQIFNLFYGKPHLPSYFKGVFFLVHTMFSHHQNMHTAYRGN